MAGIPDATLLIQDLLSPPSTVLGSTTPGLISYHLSTLALAPPSLLSAVVQTVATSPSLWRGRGLRTGDGWATLDWQRAHEVFVALRNGVVYRAGELTRQHGTGWTARRKFAHFLDQYYTGLALAPDAHPTIALLVATAALAALQAVKQRRDKLYVGGSALLQRAESETLAAWDTYFAAAQDERIGEWTGPGRGEFELRQPRASPAFEL